MTKRKKHGANSGGRQIGCGPFPSRDSIQGYGAPLHSNTMLSSPYRTRVYPLEPGRNNGRANYAAPSPTSWEGSLSPMFDDLEDNDTGDGDTLEAMTRKAEQKRREMGWSTSFPAEYHHAHQTRDYQQTLAYQDQLNQRKSSEQQLMNAVLGGMSSSSSITKGNGVKVPFPNAPSPNRQELELLKHVTMREGILESLKALAQSAGATGFPAETGAELLQLLLQLRDASVSVISAMSRWHQSMTARTSRPPAFLHRGHNYCAKMVADLNFLASFSSLGRVLGVDPARMKQNPFMMPSPIPDRDFHDIQSYSASSPPRFTFEHPLERVAEAEKYLVWSLVNLPEGIGSLSNNADPSSAPIQQSQPPLTAQGKRELLTWQHRAEQQLRLLSMPLEPPTGQARMMDLSWMMKRKGYLPSLPQSPPKTLTQLMENVEKGGYTSPTKINCFASMEAIHDGVLYRMTALDIEVLGSNEAAPHAIVTLVAASVLILLSPSDRIPKDLSWSSCQKMLSNGLKLIRRIEGVEVDAIPPFKWKALLPFLQNEHYDPMFLMEYSSAAATLCAWVLDVLERAQQNDLVATKTEEDRRDILEELEHQEEDDPATGLQIPDTLRPISRGNGSRGSKRVSIGNAEVLFINENEPVSPPSTASGSSRPTSSASATSSLTRRHVLLRTSPWTHRGVTYFVSFFLETNDDEPQEVLSIKMYEPMSSVESQMFVTQDDLRLDFGDRAAEYFQRHEFGLLCDLILTQLDGMMAPSSRGGLTSRIGAWRRPSDTIEPNAQSSEDVEAAAERVQSPARSPSAKSQLQQLKTGQENLDEPSLLEQHEASVRIQCAARQRHARKKVQHVRFTKQQAVHQVQNESATRIQSVARQRLAQKEVARMKLLHRTPTGITPAGPEDKEADAEVLGEGVEDIVAERLAGLQTLELTEEEEDQEQEDEAYPPPSDHMPSDVSRSGTRPETSMSYASEQFEDDFEEEES